jgi:hypothetical protein
MVEGDVRSGDRVPGSQKYPPLWTIVRLKPWCAFRREATALDRTQSLLCHAAMRGTTNLAREGPHARRQRRDRD